MPTPKETQWFNIIYANFWAENTNINILFFLACKFPSQIV